MRTKSNEQCFTKRSRRSIRTTNTQEDQPANHRPIIPTQHVTQRSHHTGGATALIPLRTDAHPARLENRPIPTGAAASAQTARHSPPAIGRTSPAGPAPGSGQRANNLSRYNDRGHAVPGLASSAATEKRRTPGHSEAEWAVRQGALDWPSNPSAARRIEQQTARTESPV